MPFLDILLYILLGAFGIVLWGICGLFVCAIFRNLKPMPKKPEVIPINPPLLGLSINKYREMLDYDPYSDEEWPKTKAALDKDRNTPLTDEEAIRFNAEMYKQNMKRAQEAKPFDAKVYDQDNTPWFHRDISAKGQNNV